MYYNGKLGRDPTPALYYAGSIRYIGIGHRPVRPKVSSGRLWFHG